MNVVAAGGALLARGSPTVKPADLEGHPGFEAILARLWHLSIGPPPVMLGLISPCVGPGHACGWPQS